MNIPEIKLTIKFLRDKNISGDCVTFGVQGIEVQNIEGLKKIFLTEKYNYKKLHKNEITYDSLTPLGRTIHQDVFFKMLGFSKVDSIDYFPNENPTYVANLNEPINSNLWNKYNMVFDIGTTEHCFNTKEVLSNVVRLLKVGGKIMHLNPISGGINHGYYQFSPILFFEFYGENDFTDMEAKIIVYKPEGKIYYFKYTPSMFLPIDFYGKFVYIFFTARKGTEDIDIKVPIQGYFLKKFKGKDKGKDNDNSVKNINTAPFLKFKNIIKTVLKIYPPLYSYFVPLAKQVLEKYRIRTKIKKNWLK